MRASTPPWLTPATATYPIPVDPQAFNTGFLMQMPMGTMANSATRTFTELGPGDVIITGTTGGVGAFRQPPLWMKPGDVVEVEISRIGILTNTIVDERA